MGREKLREKPKVEVCMEHHTGSQRNTPVLPEVQRETEPGEEGKVQASLRGVGKRKVAKLGGAAGANLLGRSVAAVAGGGGGEVAGVSGGAGGGDPDLPIPAPPLPPAGPADSISSPANTYHLKPSPLCLPNISSICDAARRSFLLSSACLSATCHNL